jgi:hypothetical protein
MHHTMHMQLCMIGTIHLLDFRVSFQLRDNQHCSPPSAEDWYATDTFHPHRSSSPIARWALSRIIPSSSPACIPDWYATGSFRPHRKLLLYWLWVWCTNTHGSSYRPWRTDQSMQLVMAVASFSNQGIGWSAYQPAARKAWQVVVEVECVIRCLLAKIR